MENQPNPDKPSALREIPGAESQHPVNLEMAKKIAGMRQLPSAGELIDGIFKADRAMLSRAITLAESSNPQDFERATEVISACMPRSGKSVRVGITGVPGVGKSTFIEALGLTLIGMGKRVAVLAVDPSSSVSKGSILGDKTRMQELVREPNAYIRPSPSGENLGGVARKTREAVILCEAAGFDVILIETVGVGQSETAVSSMTDFFLLLKITGAGDELQGIKRGIMELADAVVINKADGGNLTKARLARSEFSRALHFFPPRENGWQPKALTCSSANREGITQIWEMIDGFVREMTATGDFAKKRAGQNRYWMLESIHSSLQSEFFNHPKVQAMLNELEPRVANGSLSPFTAARQLLDVYSATRQSS